MLPTVDNIPSRPMLRYHGGKYRLRRWILHHFPDHLHYVEPYCGAGSVFFAKPRSYSEILNDVDGDLMNVYRVLQNQKKADQLCRRLIRTPFAREEFEKAYLETIDPIEKARRTIIRSFMGFGTGSVQYQVTGFRVRSRRSHTTPAHDWANYPPVLQVFTDRLQGVALECRPALRVIPECDDKETLFYVDPPYVHETRDRRHRDLYSGEMSDDDHVLLAECLREMRGAVIVSGYRSELYDRLYEGWEKVERHALADGASSRIECLWLSPVTMSRLTSRGQMSLFRDIEEELDADSD